MVTTKFERFNHPHPLIKALQGDNIRLDNISFRVIAHWGNSYPTVVATNEFTKLLFKTNRSGYKNNTWLSIFIVHFYKPGDYMILNEEWHFRNIPYRHVWVFGNEMLWNGEAFMNDDGKEQWDSVNVELVMKQLAALMKGS